MPLEYHRAVPHITREDLDVVLNGTDEIDVEFESLSYADIVREFKATGEYFNIDYPGGIEKLVKDFEAGELNGMNAKARCVQNEHRDWTGL